MDISSNYLDGTLPSAWVGLTQASHAVWLKGSLSLAIMLCTGSAWPHKISQIIDKTYCWNNTHGLLSLSLGRSIALHYTCCLRWQMHHPVWCMHWMLKHRCHCTSCIPCMCSTMSVASDATHGAWAKVNSGELVGSLPQEVCKSQNLFFWFVKVMQLSSIYLSDNKLEGTLPKTWGNLTNVSPPIELTSCLCRLCLPTASVSATSVADYINKLNAQHWPCLAYLSCTM